MWHLLSNVKPNARSPGYIYLEDVGVFTSKLVYFKVFLVPVLFTADDRLVQKEWILERKMMSPTELKQ